MLSVVASLEVGGHLPSAPITQSQIRICCLGVEKQAPDLVVEGTGSSRPGLSDVGALECQTPIYGADGGTTIGM